MVRLFYLLSFAVVLGALAPAARANYDEGYAAYLQGDYDRALEQFRQAAKKGDSDARFRLGAMYANGEGVRRDLYRAWRFYQQAVDDGNLNAVEEMGELREYLRLYQFATRAGRSAKNRKKSARRLLAAARKGDLDSQNDIALRYKKGDGIAQNFDKALYWLEKAAAKENPWAQTTLALMLASGDGVARDLPRALALYTQAAQTHPRAQYILARRLDAGNGVERDPARAQALYQQAADAGDILAGFLLANRFLRGYGAQAADLEQAIYWYEKVAQKGDREARMILANLYEGGQGVAADAVKAEYWYHKAAQENGLAEAAYKLAELYEHGLGEIAPDARKAARWYRDAAKKGDAEAQLRLAQLYATGEGVVQDFALAGHWFARAAKACCGMPSFTTLIAQSPQLKLNDRRRLLMYRRAAEEGNADARYMLGRWYERGELGLRKNRKTALYWYRRAARQDYPAAIEALQALQQSDAAGHDSGAG